MSIRLGIIGASGRLGQLVAELALSDSRFAVQALIVRAESKLLGRIAFASQLTYQSEMTQACDVWIDVSLPSALEQTRAAITLLGGAWVCGVTGLNAAQTEALNRFAERQALLHTHNFSRGIAVLAHLAERAAKLLGAEYQTGIVDLHHQFKIDAPSGTAISLEHALRKGGASSVQHSALRIGSIVGEHQIHFAGSSERINLTHIADSRTMFAKGALDAAAWIAQQKPGRYEMADVFGINT
jgi:4-hydroxy-tetrahydrodipicolinate reductase